MVQPGSKPGPSNPVEKIVFCEKPTKHTKRLSAKVMVRFIITYFEDE
jgi:hypothetical protein